MLSCQFAWPWRASSYLQHPGAWLSARVSKAPQSPAAELHKTPFDLVDLPRCIPILFWGFLAFLFNDIVY